MAMQTAVLLVAHGSPNQSVNAELLAMVSLVKERSRYEIVEPAFLAGASPGIPEGIDACVAQEAAKVVIIPYFLLLGRHVLEDLPAIVEAARTRHPQVQFVLGEHLGAHPLLVQLVLDRIRETGEGNL